MNGIWQLHQAKNKLSEVVIEALQHKPQIITRRGEKAVVLIAYEDYLSLKGTRMNLVAFFRNSPLVDSGIEFERDRSLPREGIEL